MAADCKSAGVSLRWFKSIPAHKISAGVAQLVEHQPSKLRVAGSNPVSRSIYIAHVAQLAEHLLGKEEVTSSSLVMGSIFKPINRGHEVAKANRHGQGKV